jgi:hypothetical protein
VSSLSDELIRLFFKSQKVLLISWKLQAVC